MKTESLINTLVINGKLPLPYYNAKVIKIKAKHIVNKKDDVILPINKKYKQVKVASGNLGILNTKIYDLY